MSEIITYNTEMLYEDYTTGTYSNKKEKLKWRSTAPKDFILTNTNNYVEYKYYGNQLTISNPGILTSIYLKPSNYILAV